MTLRGLLIALQFLTRLPVPQVREMAPNDLARSAVWFPLVGLVIGVLVMVAVLAGQTAGPWIGALAGLLAWVLITGALHLDALADVADAQGAAHGSPERFREVLADPHVGAFGVVAIVLLLTAKLVLLARLPAASVLPALILVPAWARWGTLFWSLAIPALAPGMGARFAEGKSWQATAAWGVILAGLSLWQSPVLAGALAIVPAVALYWRLRLGGMTGDCLGASVEVTEAMLLGLLVLHAVA